MLANQIIGNQNNRTNLISHNAKKYILYRIARTSRAGVITFEPVHTGRVG